MPDINLQLLPETRKKIQVHSRGENTYITLSIILALVVVGLYAAIYFYHASVLSNIQSVDNDLATLEQRRDKTAEDKLLTLYKKLKVASPLLNAHLFWSDGLARIEKLIQPQVQFKSLSMGVADNKINFKAEASSYTVVARQIAAFLSDPAFTRVSLGKVLSLSNGRVEFNMQLEFDTSKVLTRTQK